MIWPELQTIAVSSITTVGLNRYRISFAPQTLQGKYDVSVGPDIRDFAANRLDIDQDGVFRGF